MPTGFTGGCLCGAVRYRSQEAPALAGHCYCTDCRRSSGSDRCTHVVATREGFSLTGDLRFYDRAADSGNIVSRGFCPTCGAAVLSRNSAMPELVFLRSSSLDDPEVAQPAMVVYTSRAPSWSRLDPTLPSFPEMPQGGPEQAIPAQ